MYKRELIAENQKLLRELAKQTATFQQLQAETKLNHHQIHLLQAENEKLKEYLQFFEDRHRENEVEDRNFNESMWKLFYRSIDLWGKLIEQQLDEVERGTEALSQHPTLRGH